jgi:hypothetical protein
MTVAWSKAAWAELAPEAVEFEATRPADQM